VVLWVTGKEAVEAALVTGDSVVGMVLPGTCELDTGNLDMAALLAGTTEKGADDACSATREVDKETPEEGPGPPTEIRCDADAAGIDEAPAAVPWLEALPTLEKPGTTTGALLVAADR
jgi:hypothetical protein